jgi:exodeoxyribonuclease VII small subunit
MTKGTFESALKKLDEIVHALESEDHPIEEALKKFEEGIALSKFCSQKLDETERKIGILLKGQDGAIHTQPTDEDLTLSIDKPSIDKPKKSESTDKPKKSDKPASGQ